MKKFKNIQCKKAVRKKRVFSTCVMTGPEDPLLLMFKFYTFWKTPLKCGIAYQWVKKLSIIILDDYQ